MCSSAAERPQLNPKHVGPGKRQPDAAQAKERIAFLREREARDRLVGPSVERPNRDGLTAGPFSKPPIGDILLLFIRQVGAATEKEFGPDEADAVKPLEIEGLDLPEVGDVRVDRDRSPVGRDRGKRRRCCSRFTTSSSGVARTCNVEGAGFSHSVAFSASRSARVPLAGFRKSSGTPTIIGTPRDLARVATWLDTLPAVKAMPPPRLQSVMRKREGVKSLPTRIAPSGVVASTCLPLIVARTRSRISANRWLARENKGLRPTR